MTRYLGPLQAVAFLAAFAFGIPAECAPGQLDIFNGLDLASLVCAASFLILCAVADRARPHTTTETEAQ